MLNPEIQNLLELLRREGWDVVCAGGAARDGALGIEPKDYDVVVLCGEGTRSTRNRMKFVLAKLGMDNLESYTDGGDESYMDDGTDRIAWVVSGTANGVPFDVIEYASAPSSIEEQVEMFDCNLNFFWYSECGRFVESAQRSWTPGSEVVFTPYLQGDDINKRVHYLRNKFPNIRFPNDSTVYQQVKGLI